MKGLQADHVVCFLNSRDTRAASIRKMALGGFARERNLVVGGGGSGAKGEEGEKEKWVEHWGLQEPVEEEVHGEI